MAGNQCQILDVWVLEQKIGREKDLEEENVSLEQSENRLKSQVFWHQNDPVVETYHPL